MARWITKSVGGAEVLRVREGFQFTWSGVTYPANYIENASDAELQAKGFAVEEIENPVVPVRVESISRRQFFHALYRRGAITKAECMAALKGDIPTALIAAINQIPDLTAREDIEILVTGVIEFRRDHPATPQLGAALGYDDAGLDDLWAFASSL